MTIFEKDFKMSLMIGVQDQDTLTIDHKGERLTLTFAVVKNCKKIIIDGPRDFVVKRGNRDQAKEKRKARRELGN